MQLPFLPKKHSPYRISILVAIFLISIVSGYAGGLLADFGSVTIEPVRQPIVIEDRTRSQTAKPDSLAGTLYTAIRPSILSLYRVNARDLEKPWTERTLVEQAFLGFATAVTSDGWIATPLSLKDGDLSKVLAIDSDHNAYLAKKIAADPATGMHFIKIDSKNLKAIQMAPENVPSPQDAFVVSDINVRREELSILSYSLPKEPRDALQSTDSLAKRFNPSTVYDVSGLPLVSLEKEVLGVTSPRGVIPIQYVSRGLRAVLKFGVVKRPQAGLLYFDNEHLPLIPTPPNRGRAMSGATIVSTKPFITIPTPTGTARLFSGDVVTAVNADTVSGQRSLSELLHEYQPGDPVQLKIDRGGKPLIITMLLE